MDSGEKELTEDEPEDLGFRFHLRDNGEVAILRNNVFVTVLRYAKAVEFTAKSATVSFADQQQMMARLTGNYRRGNERTAKSHRRNQ